MIINDLLFIIFALAGFFILAIIFGMIAWGVICQIRGKLVVWPGFPVPTNSIKLYLGLCCILSLLLTFACVLSLSYLPFSLAWLFYCIILNCYSFILFYLHSKNHNYAIDEQQPSNISKIQRFSLVIICVYPLILLLLSQK